jgi:hypothetical protein
MKDRVQPPSQKSTYCLDALLIFILTAAVIWPLFKTRYLASWGSIESIFIADARFLMEHWPHPRWQPLWYLGTRFDYIYPPGLRYGTAALAKYFHLLPARGYHLYVAILYCLGIAGVYLLIRIGSRSRPAAWLGAFLVAFVSPSYLFIAEMRHDAKLVQYAPARLNVLIRYGEGPHMSAVALLGFALAFAFLGLQKRQSLALSVSAVFCALVVSNNFYGATSLAILFPTLVWALWLTHNDRWIWGRAFLVAALAYGLTAFWLVPSYIRVTTENMRVVSRPGNVWSVAAAAAAVALFAFFSWKFARGRPERAYLVWISGMFGFMTLNVLGEQFFGFRVAGEPSRLVPELDLVMVLLGVEIVRRCWIRTDWRFRTAMVTAIAVCFWPLRLYLQNPHRVFVRDPKVDERIEYKLTTWIAANLPDTRNMATGSLRFWYDGWHDLAQIGGGSEQGMLNYVSYEAQWQIVGDADAALTTLWMQALGGDALVMHFKNSKELYHDWTKPEKLAGHLPVIYDNGEGDVIYRVPRRFPDRARVVETARLRALPPVLKDQSALQPYVQVVENGPDSPARVTRDGPDAMRIRATLKSGESVIVQETWDPAWRAWSGGRALEIRKDSVNFMEIVAPPGEQEIRLEFGLPLENLIGRILTVAAAVAAIAWATLAGRRSAPPDARP